MKSNAIAITGLGMLCAIGRNVVTSCASARAGITRESELTVANFTSDQLWGNEPVVGHTAVSIAQGFTGLGKVISLGSLALQDLMRRTNIGEQDTNRTGLYINLSDKYCEDAQAKVEYDEARADTSYDWSLPSHSWREESRQLIPRLASLCELDIPVSNQAIYYGNHAGVVEAVLDAVKNIVSGNLDRCIIGGIDSCIEPRYLIAAALNGLLKTAVNPAGFMPGEAAAFFLLERLNHALSCDTEVWGIIEAPSLAAEKCQRLSGDPSLGIALAQAIETSLSSLDRAEHEIGLVIGDLSGDPFSATEWGYAVICLERMFGIADLPLWLPSVSFGEVGAATGAVSVCLGIRALQRGYARTDGILVWLSSDSGSKGAFCLKNASQ